MSGIKNNLFFPQVIFRNADRTIISNKGSNKMPYINKETVKEIKSALKKNLPEYKFSVTGGNSSSLQVSVMEGPIDLGKYEQVNHVYIEKFYGERIEVCLLLKKIIEIIDGVHGTFEIQYDYDYGSIPNFYTNLAIGKYNKEYKIK